jgi:hypothetical protein
MLIIVTKVPCKLAMVLWNLVKMYCTLQVSLEYGKHAVNMLREARIRVSFKSLPEYRHDIQSMMPPFLEWLAMQLND